VHPVEADAVPSEREQDVARHADRVGAVLGRDLLEQADGRLSWGRRRVGATAPRHDCTHAPVPATTCHPGRGTSGAAVGRSARLRTSGEGGPSGAAGVVRSDAPGVAPGEVSSPDASGVPSVPRAGGTTSAVLVVVASP